MLTFQFQLTVNLSAVLLACISAIASSQEQSVLTAVQLLWINLIQDTFAALALATDPPTLSLLDRNPDPPNSSIITVNMWKTIIGQSVFQLIITLILVFAGSRIFTDWDTLALNTVIFNTYVWLQFFNQFHCRRIDNYLNVFYGIHRNWLFITISTIIAGGQIIIIFVGGKAFSVTRLNVEQWVTSVVLGLFSLPVGAIIRLIPNRFIEQLVPPRWRGGRQAEVIEQGPNEMANEMPDNRPPNEPRQGRFGRLKLRIRQRFDGAAPVPLESLSGTTYADTPRLEEQPIPQAQEI
jgi:P-type Ca2+ transporter type 2C